MIIYLKKYLFIGDETCRLSKTSSTTLSRVNHMADNHVIRYRILDNHVTCKSIILNLAHL